jgi:aryl-alcohol dehydrogenase-like predicted oxidoreductase
METRVLPGTDLTVSRLCLGTMTFGKQADERAAASMLDLCLERGVNFFDTANVYNAGVSETILGLLLKGRRDRVVLASKVGVKAGDGPLDSGLSRGAAQHHIEESLRRLQTDAVDLYYLHQPDPKTPLEESLSAMDGLVRQGKVRTVGASNYAAWQVCRMRWLAETSGYRPVSVTQPMYNLLARGIEAEYLPMCRALGVATVIYNPLAGGLLTGKHQADQAPPAGTRFDGNAIYRNRYWHAENFAAVSRLAAAARAEGRSLISVALGWLLHHTSIDCIILGASSLAQLRDNLQAAEDGPCSEATVAVCNEVWTSLRGITPAYMR